MAVKKSSANATSKRAGKISDSPDISLKAISGFVTDKAAGDFHRLLNDRVRLGMLSSLAVSPCLSFKELKTLLSTSDGNLSVHARKLESAGYVGCEKKFEGRIPKTEFTITSKGRKSLSRYLKHMEALIKATSG